MSPRSAQVAPPEAVADRAGRALGWSLLNTMVARFGSMAIGIIIARLLGPEEFGTFAVAFVALMAVLSFNELGVSLAIVRWPNEPEEIAPTVNTISLAMSAVLTVAMIAVAPAFASAMGDPDAAGLVQLLSLCVLINGLVATPAALMQRFFRQDQRMIADQVNVWVGAFVSVGLAWAGWGASSLVIGRLAGAGLSALVFLHYSPLPYRVGFERSQARALLAFGLPLAGSSIVVFCVGFMDQLVVGHVLGTALLGFYVIAVNLSSWPVTMFSQPLRSVAPALFSRLQHDPPVMRRAFLQVLRLLGCVALPACVAISVAAPAIIGLVYGEVWLPAAAVLSWLALFAAVRIFSELVYDYLVVLGRSSAILTVQVVWLVVLLPVLWLAVSRNGIQGGGAALFGVAALVSVPMYVVQLSRAGIRVRAVAAAVWQPLVFSAVAAAVTWAALTWVGDGFVGLALGGLLSLGTIALAMVTVRADVRELRGLRS
jgi:O-antigen/teichoic acid export membrane protein